MKFHVIKVADQENFIGVCVSFLHLPLRKFRNNGRGTFFIISRTDNAKRVSQNFSHLHSPKTDDMSHIRSSSMRSTDAQYCAECLLKIW